MFKIVQLSSLGSFKFYQCIFCRKDNLGPQKKIFEFSEVFLVQTLLLFSNSVKQKNLCSDMVKQLSAVAFNKFLFVHETKAHVVSPIHWLISR